MKFRTATIVSIGLIFASGVSAHVVVRPDTVGVAARQNFVVGVPTEKDVPTTGLRLVLPEGLESVTPFVKPGWQIEVKESGEGEEAMATEIIWSGGSIPDGLRDEFVFSARVPAEEAKLVWKAYQTYQDGSVVSWDQDPETLSEEEESDIGPYSVTKIIDDLSAESAETTSRAMANRTNIALIVSVVAVVLAGATLFKHKQS